MLKRPRKDAIADEIVELAALADRSLAPDRRAALETRVAASPHLAAPLAEQRRAVVLTQDAASQVAAPLSLRERIEEQRRERRRPILHRPGLIGAGMAVATVLAVGIGLTVLTSGSPQEQLEAALAPTELAPAASGEATLTRTSSGWRIELDASGLPRLDRGRFYEAWLRNPAGVLVPIGTFNEGRNVTLWAGVSPEDFTTLTITRELADDDQASSGEKVLVGTVDTSG